MLEALKTQTCEANLALVRSGLVLQTWGNASAIDRKAGRVVIKPSGVAYDLMHPEDMVVVDLDGDVAEGALRPSVDLPAHLVLYHAFPEINAVVHTHSHYATCFAQARRPIPCFGTTHADYFYGEVPLTEPLTEAEVEEDYERHIGEAIVRRYASFDALMEPADQAATHARFVRGATVGEAVENAVVLEEVARMALHTLTLNTDAVPLERHLLDKHFLRKHGKGAYYGQTTEGAR